MRIQIINEFGASCGTVPLNSVRPNRVVKVLKLGSITDCIIIPNLILDKFAITFEQAKRIAYVEGNSEPLPYHHYGYRDGLIKYLDKGGL